MSAEVGVMGSRGGSGPTATRDAQAAVPEVVVDELGEVTEPEEAPPLRPMTPAVPVQAVKIPRPTLVSPIPALLAASMHRVEVEGGVPHHVLGAEVTSRQGQAEREALLSADAEYVVEVITSEG